MLHFKGYYGFSTTRCNYVMYNYGETDGERFVKLDWLTGLVRNEMGAVNIHYNPFVFYIETCYGFSKTM